MINKLIIDGNNVELNESSKMPYTHTFQQAETHVVKFGLDNTNEICAYAFKDCSNLTKIEIPETIEMLKRGAFMNCSKLPSITLNKNINYIGNQCFDGCTSLEEIIFEGDENRTVPKVYCKLPNQTTVYIPDDSKYKKVDFETIDTSGDIDYYTKTTWGQFIHVDNLTEITQETDYYRNVWDSIGDNNKIKENKNRRPVERIIFDSPTYSSQVGKTIELFCNILPEDCTNLNLTWTSTKGNTSLELNTETGNPKSTFVIMKEVDNTGSAIVTCQSESGIKSSITFYINPATE